MKKKTESIIDGIEVMKGAMYGLICKNSVWKAWDDLTNAELKVEDVKAARDLDMEYFPNTRVYDQVDLSGLKGT